MSSETYDLVELIAIALDAVDKPPIKRGVIYRIMVFKEKNSDNWVVALLPDIVEVEELFLVVNEAYDKFLAGEKTPSGITFLSAAEPKDLITLAVNWYYEPERDTSTSV